MSKQKGDESADSLKEAESKFVHVSTVLSTLLPHSPSGTVDTKPWEEEKGLKEMLPGEGQSTKQVKEITTADLIMPIIGEILIKVTVITTSSFICSLVCLSRKRLQGA